MPGRTRSPRWLFPLVIITVMMTLVIFASRRERAAPLPLQQTEQERLKVEIEREEHNRAALPRADYAAPEPQDPILRQIWRVRGKRYPESRSFEDMGDTTDMTRALHELLDVPGLPVAQSDLIVVGTVTDAEGHLTARKGAAYSEYTINVTEVIKGAAKLVGSQISAERFGAMVVLPGGRTIVCIGADEGTPEINHRYVMFLKYSPEGQDYPIVTAYDLRKGKVMSIDRMSKFEFFDGNDESVFLDLVRSSAK